MEKEKRKDMKGGMDLSISADTLRGYTDTIILTQLMKKDSYGYEINKTVQQRTKGQYEFKEATLYTAFKRLGQNGLITSYWGEEGPGARRRYYRITDEGRKQWKEKSREWQEIRSLLDSLLTLEVEHESD